MSDRLRRVWVSYGGLILLGAVGVPIGMAVGGIDAVFGRVLIAIGDLRDAHPFWFIPFLAAAGALIAWSYLRFGKNTGRGMSLVFDVGLGRENVIPLRLIPHHGWHLAHASVWRQCRPRGVAVQIGATLSHWIGSKLPFKHPGNTFLLVGMAAGFAGLFRTPLAATLFALEVLVAGRLELQALFPALTASIAASWTSGALGLSKFEVALSVPSAIDAHTLGLLLLLGLCFGIVGGLFAWCLKWGKKIAAAHLENPIKRIAIMGAALSVVFLLLWQGRYSGLGTNLISASFSPKAGTAIMPWDWALKFVLKVLTLSAGFRGGEVTPLFSIGASLGVVLGSLLGLPVPLVAALGYAAVFGSATNTLLAPTFIGAEVFGFAYLPHFFVVCAVAYLFNMDKSIYTLQEVAYHK